MVHDSGIRLCDWIVCVRDHEPIIVSFYIKAIYIFKERDKRRFEIDKGTWRGLFVLICISDVLLRLAHHLRLRECCF